MNQSSADFYVPFVYRQGILEEEATQPFLPMSQSLDPFSPERMALESALFECADAVIAAHRAAHQARMKFDREYARLENQASLRFWAWLNGEAPVPVWMPADSMLRPENIRRAKLESDRLHAEASRAHLAD